MAEWPRGTPIVAYWAGPHCDGADRAAAHRGGLSLPVKVMIGRVEDWADEGPGFTEREAPVPNDR